MNFFMIVKNVLRSLAISAKKKLFTFDGEIVSGFVAIFRISKIYSEITYHYLITPYKLYITVVWCM